jgi:hypothetical protein
MWEKCIFIMNTVAKIPEVLLIIQIFIWSLLSSGMDKWRNREKLHVIEERNFHVSWFSKISEYVVCNSFSKQFCYLTRNGELHTWRLKRTLSLLDGSVTRILWPCARNLASLSYPEFLTPCTNWKGKTHSPSTTLFSTGTVYDLSGTQSVLCR